MSIDLAARILKAAAEPTRLRLLLLLAGGEATVGELQDILEQSQPRVSRHLRLLAEAGLVERFRDGQSVYYRLAAGAIATEVAALARALVSPEEAGVWHDAEALDRVMRARKRAALSGPALIAAARSGPRPEPAELHAVLDEFLVVTELRDVLDAGCGGGALLPWLSAHAHTVTGVDIARPMRLLARSRMQAAGLSNCTVRDADLHALPFNEASFDVAVLDEVLSKSSQPAAALAEVRRVLRPAGRLIVFDYIQPAARQLGPGVQDLAENQLNAALTAAGFRVRARRWLPGRALEYAAFVAEAATAAERTGTDG